MSQAGKIVDASGTGDVVGPGSATDKALVRFDGTTGKLIQNGVFVETDAGELQGSDGLTGTPAYSFLSEASMGFYRSGAGTIAYAQGGSDRFSCSSTTFLHTTNTQFNGPVLVYDKLTYPNIIIPVASPYVAADTDLVILINTGSAYTVQLPDSALQGQIFIIKDYTGTGAGTNNITVTTPGGTTTIDGVTSYVMNVNRASITVLYNTTLGGYLVL